MEALDNSSPTFLLHNVAFMKHTSSQSQILHTKHLSLTKSVPTKMQSEVETMINKSKHTEYIKEGIKD